ncbi:MAG: hypothetical protein ACJ762_11770 [Solirubrobacteraceae bacterium]
MGIDRAVLTGPDWIARAASSAVPDPRQRWMLRQPRDVRRSYAAEVLGRPGEARLAEAWMLLQPDAVRRSFVDEVLSAPEEPPAAAAARRRPRRR